MTRFLRLLAALSAVALIVTACGGGDGGEVAEEGGDDTEDGATATEGRDESDRGDEDGTAEGGLVTIRHAASSSADAYVGQFYAAEEFGEEFGIDPNSELTEFDSHATSAQMLLSGGADVGSGTLTQVIQLLVEGQDFKAICPLQKDSTEYLMGRTEAITDLEQITDPDVRVAVDSPGGLINFIMNIVFRERGLDITVDDLQNVTILEDGDLRLSALASGDVDVGSVDIFEQADLREQVGDENVTVLSVAAEDADFVSQVYFASSEWLEENSDAAARLCATTLHANRELAREYERYKEIVDEHIQGGVDEEITRTNWEFAREHEIWPYNVYPVMEESEIDKVVDVSSETGVVDEAARDLSYEDIVATDVLEAAMELLGGEVDPDEIVSGDG